MVANVIGPAMSVAAPKAKPQIIESDNSDANNSGADTPMSSTKSESSSTSGAKVGKKKVRVLQSSEEEKGNHL